MSSDNTTVEIRDWQNPRVGSSLDLAMSSDKTCSRNSSDPKECLPEQWLREMPAGKRLMSVPFPSSERESDPFESILQCLIGKMGVDLGCGDVSVSESALYEEQVRGGCVEMGCERVTESVRGDVLCDARLLQPVFQPLCYLPVAEPCAFGGNEERAALSSRDLLALLQILAEERSEGSLEELGLRDVPLAHDADVLPVQVHVLDVEVYEFGQANARSEEDLEDDTVTLREWVRPVVKFLEESSLLRLSKECRWLSGKAFCRNGHRGTGFSKSGINSPCEE